ncbi:Ger(x)C family spore germination protein [Paenibacillus sp. CF384]|uniref:Ger(x)C family spore germination protein n=1 Tax=Paenibacillus sp. CF384 TaxID=1884382 RepID=UPI00089845AE|nr:Ger(x)C family spore germination protein [Paenibacillus sp. CF384]SDX71176.1 germination protein, Ger(x)C family [Paenibacillus sp. CF384]
MKKVMTALILCLLLTGCWDQDKLKNMLFVDVIGIDYEENSKQLKASFVTSSLENASTGGGKPNNLYLEATGDDLYDAVSHVNKQHPGILSVQQTRLYLISPKFAKDQPLDYLNIAGQFLNNPTYAHLALYDGDISKLLEKKMNDQTVSDYLVGLIEDENKRGTFPRNKLLQYMFEGNAFINDFALTRYEPYGDGARLAGTSLFREGTYTGINLDAEDTLLAHLMDGAKGKSQLIVGEIGGESYSILVKNAKADYPIIYKDNRIREIEVSLRLDVKLIKDGLKWKKHTSKMLTEMEKKIADDLTPKVAKVMETLQKANCDSLQLGHRVAAYHPKLYAGMNWREVYPTIKMKTIVKIKILNTGILD